MKSLTIRGLRIFEAAASTGNFSRAAELLNLTQPAISVQIKTLEDEVGTPLFDKNARPIALTDAGREFLRHARVILAQVRTAEDAMATLEGTFRGQLHLGVVSTANYFAPKLMMAFRRIYPDVRLKLSVGKRDEILAMLNDHRLDIAIAGYPPAHADIDAEAFARHPHCIVASASHPLRDERHIDWSALIDEPFLFREAGSATRQFFEHLLQCRSIQVHVSSEFQGTETIKQAVMAGMGLTFISAHAVQTELEASCMAILDVIDMPKMLDWCVLTRRDAPLSAVSQAFKDFVMAEGEALTRCVSQPDDLFKSTAMGSNSPRQPAVSAVALDAP
ncbi:LysR substrate-binding domain-containing protein [Ideonella sp.]|uniref:LysR substrate-binding domain-containing protein n=1 Tax=Ideonella sp. TaxID=1929293 RepID=UPI003BB56FC2